MDSQEIQRTTGIVRCYYPIRGFGFIRRAKGADVFFHREDAKGEEMLFDGSQVSFELRKEPRGPRAFNILRVG